MYLVGYLYEDYHDARSLERKVYDIHNTIISTGELPSFSPFTFLIITPPIFHHRKPVFSLFLSDLNRTQYRRSS
jgi:hypothetical protein